MIEWKVLKLHLYPQEQQMTDVVCNVNWKCSAIDQGYEAWITDNTPLTAPSEAFTPYDQLTEEQVLNWVWSSIDKAEIEEKMQKALRNLITPPIVVKPLPWEIPPPAPEPAPEPSPDPAPETPTE